MKKTIFKVMRFFISGGICAVVGFTILYSLTEYAGLWYLLSSIISFILTDILGFVIRKFWVFENNDIDIKKAKFQILLYVLLSITYLITNTGLLYILVEYLHIQYIYSQMILIVILLSPNYILSHRIFPAREAQ